MTQINFYVLSEPGAQARAALACRLTEKAYKLGHKVYLHTQTDQDAGQLDDFLWTFRAGSFVPHARIGTQAKDGHDAAPVLVGSNTAPPDDFNVLINLGQDVPAFFDRFERVAEIVDASDEQRQQARARFRAYRDRGYEPETHKL